MNQEKKAVIALGFFDGVHLGHQALLRRTVERARELHMIPAVYTFDRSPREAVTGVPVPLLVDPAHRRQVITARFPIEELIVAPFDHALMTMPWETFVEMLTERYSAGWLVAGHDFRFGHKNIGTAALLQEKATALGLGCDIIPAVTLDGVVVSSTHIRALLERGDAAEAARFLGHPFSIAGTVRHGRGLGSRLRMPTANLLPPAGQIVPAYGVYVTQVAVEGRRYPAITNVGVRPTVDQQGAVTVESHLLDCGSCLYGHDCRVAFLERVRPERKFPDLESLRAQVAKDTETARAYFHGK